MDAVVAVRELGGAARRNRIVALVGRREFDRAVRQRQIIRERTGVYTSGTSYERVLAAQVRGVPSHLTAAWRWNLGLARFPEIVDITVPRRSTHRVVPPGVRLHYSDLRGDEVVEGVTSPVRTIVDCLRAAPAPLALAVVEDALRTDRVGADALRGQIAARRGARSGRARRILGWVDSRAASPLESALRGILLDADITCFQPQFEVRVGPARIATVDLGDPKSGVLLEADSFLWHGQREQLARDAVRYDELVASGYRVLRFATEHVAERGQWVLETILRTLELSRR